MEIKKHIIREVQVPYKLIFKNTLFDLVNLHRKFIIKDYIVKTVDGNIDSIFLTNPHPNANPKNGEFCISNNLRKVKFDKKSLNLIRSMICCFNLDDCYFTPWDEIQYQHSKKEEIDGEPI